MTILPINPAEDASSEALRAFLTGCQAKARADGAMVLASISLVVPALDPLAVLESIFEATEPHFYTERPSDGSAIAGAEVALQLSAHGADRFAAVQRFIDETLVRTVAVGDVNAPFGGPHFFTSFAFLDEVEPGEVFPAAHVFVPRWQVARAGEVTTAVANIVVEAGSDLDALAARVWRAHGKFARFEFGAAEESADGLVGVGPGGGMGVSPMGSEGGMGVSPMGLSFSDQQTEDGATRTEHGRDAHATPEMGQHGRDARATFKSETIQVRQGAYLPHWSREGGIYAVTFRLADSLPFAVLQAWREERSEIERKAVERSGVLGAAERQCLDDLHSERIEAYLDSGKGECWLARADIAETIRDALGHFEGTRYRLHAWCIMPNHVHLIIEPLGRESLAEILHGLKSFTAKKANARLAREGAFWQPEYYDHLIRDALDYSHAVAYLDANPEKAGLRDWPWIQRGSLPDGSRVSGFGSGMGVSPMSLSSDRKIGQGATDSEHGRDAHATTDQAHGRDARATLQFTQSETGDYRATVRRGLECIHAGEFKKIVLARAIDLTANRPLHPLTVLNGLRQRFPDCYAFSAANGKGQSFIGASPERLLRVSQGRVETEALAGSARRGAGASEDAALAAALLRSEKDVREHSHVIESITRRLEPLGVRLEPGAATSVRKLANVQHLHTPMRGVLPEGVRLLDVLAVLHPTPAVGGTPREAAVARIRELEGFPRGLYAGALGWINSRGGGEFFVGLRSALIDGERARVYAGAGIVAGSEPERELAETELKFQALLAALRG